jgi:hypothetical protein
MYEQGGEYSDVRSGGILTYQSSKRASNNHCRSQSNISETPKENREYIIKLDTQPVCL